jgi:trimethylamine:corrinoid methyltransferase-like protein
MSGRFAPAFEIRMRVSHGKLRSPVQTGSSTMADAGTTSDRRFRRGAGGADARRAARSGGHQTQLTYIKRNIPIYEVLSEEGLEGISRQ